MPATSNQNLTWSIDKPLLASLESDGQSAVVYADGVGKVTVTAVSADGKKKAKCVITIANHDKLSVSSKSQSVIMGKTLNLNASYGTTKMNNADLIWAVSSADGLGAASINSKGVLTALKEGKVLVYAINPVSGSVSEGCPVDIYVPGCAARPQAIIDGIVKAVALFQERLSKNEEEVDKVG